MNNKFITLIVLLLVLPTLVLAQQSNTEYSFNLLDAPTFNNATASVNVSDFWNTNIGILGEVNDTQFENNGGTLSIIASWLESFIISVGNLNWIALDGSNDATAITLNGSTITDWSNVNNTEGGGIWTNVSGVATFEGGINVTDNTNVIALYMENGYLVVEG